MAKTKNLKVENTATVNPAQNQVKIEQLREKFDALQDEINNKTYGVVLDHNLTKTLIEEIYPTFTWKGYESYAITETYNQITASVKNKEINSKFPTEVIEAVFHFLKSYEGKGVSLAHNFKLTCDAFAVAIQEINEDRQQLKDLSLELVATEQGIDVNDLVKSLNDGTFQG